MSATRPLLALLVLLSLLAPAGAEAKAHPRKATKKHHVKKHKQRKPARVKPVAVAGPIGTVTAIDGDLVTVTLARGGSITASVVEGTAGACPTSADPDTDDDDVSDDDLGDDTEDDGDFRSARLASACAAALGSPVYALTVDEGVFDALDLIA